MPTMPINGASIYYEILGRSGPWFAVMSGGRHPLSEVKRLARFIAFRGYRVLIHDRRNCGQSSFHFSNLVSEDEAWVNDLHSLLKALDIEDVFLVGKSRTVRVAVHYALLYPRSVRGLGLWGISGGKVAVRFLADYYYNQYIRACRIGGMKAVCGLDHFSNRNSTPQITRDILLAMEPDVFVATLERLKAHDFVKTEQKVLGIDDEELHAISVPTVIMPVYDSIHPLTSSLHAREIIAVSKLVHYEPKSRFKNTWRWRFILSDKIKVANILCKADAEIRQQ